MTSLNKVRECECGCVENRCIFKVQEAGIVVRNDDDVSCVVCCVCCHPPRER